MVPYKAFICLCERGNVVLRESHQPQSRGKLYYAFPLSKDRVRLLAASPGASMTPSYHPGPSTTPSYSSRPLTPPSDSPGPSMPLSDSLRPSRNVECSNCKLLIGKIKVL
nr:hypothetical protein [Tanacetum cinerariifolium]